jgi:hypothetical protein
MLMSLILDDGSELHFGQKLEEIERRYSCRARDNPSPIARKEIDKIVEIDRVELSFDSGFLLRVNFTKDYRFVNPPAPYPEEWKNFREINSRRIYARMPREEFLSYVSAWEKRAVTLGAEKVPAGDLAAQQFVVSMVHDEYVDMVNVDLGTSRRAKGGGIWCDGWNAFFDPRSEKAQTEFPTLKTLSAFRDEFNTVARRR